ncbi:MAG: glycoside hydrolase family 97 catalytic domain-containing protein [Marinilabiliales bacterium]|nr:glycoside hydrolase family 97 catalytic domain-containing protein [Marinilabiliales bacterium]
MWITGDGKGGSQALFPAYPAAEKLERDRDVYVTATGGLYCQNIRHHAHFRGVSSSSLLTMPGWLRARWFTGLGHRLHPVLTSAGCSPGKVAWDWYNANNLFGVDFRAGLNNDTYKYYIDFASENGIEYVILDEGWYNIGNVLDDGGRIRCAGTL